jgi:hypothetical protein
MNRFIFWEKIKSRIDESNIGLGLYAGYANKNQYRMLASVHMESNNKYSWYTFDAYGVAGLEGISDSLEQAQKEAAHAVIEQGFIDLGKLNGK